MSIELYPQKKIPSYPIAKNGIQCVGPCYPANVGYTHPETGRFIRDDTANCPILPTLSIKNGVRVVRVNADCYYKKGNDQEIRVDVDLGMNLQYSQFLKLYYKIYTFDDALLWIDKNKGAQLETKERIIDSAIITFKSNIQVIDDSLVNLYIEIISGLWFNDLYRMLNEFIIIEDGLIKFKIISEDDIKRKKDNLFSKDVIQNDSDAKIKTDLIKQNFVNVNFVHSFLKKVIIKTEDSVNIKKSLVLYILSKLPRS